MCYLKAYQYFVLDIHEINKYINTRDKIENTYMLHINTIIQIGYIHIRLQQLTIRLIHFPIYSKY